MASRSYKKLSAADRVFHVICTFWLSLAGLVVLYPLVYALACSFSSTEAIMQGRVFLYPVDVSLKAYGAVFEHDLIVSGFLNSLMYVAGGTVVAVTLLILAAYPLSRRDLPDRKLFQTFFVITMFFNGGIIPNYILMRNLHLIGSRWALVVGFLFSCYNMIIVRSYFMNSLPSGILDAAHIDGCGDFRFFITIAVPLSMPVISVMVLFNAVMIWNEYFRAMLYLTRAQTYNFQIVLRNVLFIAQMPPEMVAAMDPNASDAARTMLQQLRYAVLIVGALPMMTLYPFIQKYFIRGMLIGSLKE
ncbi:MAG: carbohydrate ABC transporter permease [Spirochaetaceae bacterium]|jgi:multiple sugar transport system permease protein/putative aldouronate transport system permease protein|nr:carbohydrate ABC transporter permease [Spirochaetaceae bacterium]